MIKIVPVKDIFITVNAVLKYQVYDIFEFLNKFFSAKIQTSIESIPA